jgi:adenine/guanine phosphoribosyltransferase-like PRPP-binding protein
VSNVLSEEKRVLPNPIRLVKSAGKQSLDRNNNIPKIMSPSQGTHFTESTTEYWQEILLGIPEPPPWQYSIPISLPDNRILELPIRPLPSDPTKPDLPTEAVASLLVNQASISVVEELGTFLADKLRPYHPDIIIGLPTLGLTLAPIVAQKLGHSRYVPMGYSRKFWYQDNLSTAVSSITSPGVGEKRVYLDPHQLPLIRQKRVAIIDDAVSSGNTLSAVWDLLEEFCAICVCGVAMKQGRRWETVLGTERASKVVGVFDSPLLKAVDGGWVVRE